MQVLKFGGTSLANAARIQNAAEIVAARSKSTRVGMVVSAVAGMTDQLVDSLEAVQQDQPWQPWVETFCQHHLTIIHELNKLYPKLDAPRVRQQLKQTSDDYQTVLQSIAKHKPCPLSTYSFIISLGEQISVHIMHAVLQAMALDAAYVDSRDYIVTGYHPINAEPLYDEIYRRFAPLTETGPRVLVMAGFIGSNQEGQLTTLGRNGSDFSAALMAVGLKAERLEIWTDVDGIFSADPRKINDAIILPEMNYEEAMELAFLGANVIHPKTIFPVARQHIPTFILNSLNAKALGTQIHSQVRDDQSWVTGVSCLPNVCMITLRGPGIPWLQEPSTRILSAISRQHVAAIAMTTSHSKDSLQLCVLQEEAIRAEEALRDEFKLELEADAIHTIEHLDGVSMVSVVRDKIRPGTSAKLIAALAKVDVKMIALAQGSAERSLSAIVSEVDADHALQAIHGCFFHKPSDTKVQETTVLTENF